MTVKPPIDHAETIVSQAAHAVRRLWNDESATQSGRSVKLATAVITLLGATGVASQFILWYSR